MAPESRVVGAGELVDHPKKIACNYLRGYFLIDFFVVLPLPQVTLSLSFLVIASFFCCLLLSTLNQCHDKNHSSSMGV